MGARRVVRRLGKIALAVVGLGVLAGGGGLGYLAVAKPDSRPPSTEVVERTPERLARGAYLVEHLLPCVGCHSEHDVTHFDAPVIGGKAAGGFVFDRTLGLPGVVQPPNLTPDPETGTGTFTDGELARAIREGIGRDGRALFPMMPYQDFRVMSDEDLRAVIAYLRTMPPVRKKTAPVQLDFPVSLFIRTAPAPVEGPVAAPDPTRDALAYGGYLVKLAGCHGCHTAMGARGQTLPGQDFAGGREFPMTWEGGKLGPRVVTANITPDPTGYFGHTTREAWITRVRAYATVRDEPPAMVPGTNTLMPWIAFSGLTERDLGAIYDFMKTVRPVRAVVNSFPDAPR